MSTHPADPWVQRPAVTSTIAYGGLIAIWFLWIACTARFPTAFDAAPYRLVPTPLYLAFSAANVGLAAWLVASFRPARAAGPGRRRGQLAGLASALVFVGVLQAGAQALHAAWPHEDGRDPARIAAYLDGRTADERAVLEAARAAILANDDGVEEALDEHGTATLHYRRGGLWLAGLRAEDGRVSLRFSHHRSVADADSLAPWKLGEGRGPRSIEVDATLVATRPERTAEVVRTVLSSR